MKYRWLERAGARNRRSHLVPVDSTGWPRDNVAALCGQPFELRDLDWIARDSEKPRCTTCQRYAGCAWVSIWPS